MRIWSLHSKYLDAKGLVALWRETLLAKNVLLGNTRGYTQHPQLQRFRAAKRPVDAVNQYLAAVFDEATQRGYKFNRDKFEPVSREQRIAVTDGQIVYEQQHLLNKLKLRDPERYAALQNGPKMVPHPLFQVISGDVEPWEKL
ncbi:MAG: hypothetical protein JXX29_17655 [Deltaproteobacteria bacterium]|nr:hypothetical protein [Deltaproteobacteria bacterium]MBN2673511.1 hypothetical protein [Deltaproteobacteria bacterium]